MKTLIWDSESDSLEQFLGLAGKYVDIDLFEDIEDLVSEAADGDLLIFDLDFERKLLEKKLKGIKKSKINVNLIFITSKMSPKEIAKHQKSKLGGDVYLKCPVDERVLVSILEPLTGQKLAVGLLDKQRQVLSEHEERVNVDKGAIQVSEMLDTVFRETLGEISDSDQALREIEELEKRDESAALRASQSASDGTYPDLDLSAMQEGKVELSDDLIDEEPAMAIDDKELDLDEVPELEVGDTSDSGLDLSLDDNSALELGDDEGDMGLSLSDNNEELGNSFEDESLELGIEAEQEDDNLADLGLSDGMELGLGEEDSLETEDVDLSIEGNNAELSLSDDLENQSLGEDDMSSFDLSDETEGVEFGVGEESEEIDLSQQGADAELNFADDVEELDDISFGAQELQEPQETHEEFKINTDSGFDLGEEELSLSDDDMFAQADGDLSLSADSLPDAPALNSSSTQSSEMSDDALEKLAEIEEMMAHDGGMPSSDVDLASQLNAEEEDYDPTQDESEGTEVFSYNTHNDSSLDELDSLSGGSFSDDSSFSSDSLKTIDEQKGILANNDNEFSRLGETIKHLRQDRQALLDKVAQLEEKISNDKSDFSNQQAELEEKRIEISLLNKRRIKQMEELRYRLELSEEKKIILEEKNKRLEQENEKLRKKTSVDLNQIKNRERELENKLELLKADTELQIRNRDFKILELKRKIDTLEFDMESIQVKEKKTVDNKYAMEERMERVINTLRRAIGELEEDEAPLRDIQKIKKNLDV